MIVIADDSAVHRVAMTAMLERAGFEVHAAHDGAEAVSLISEVRPDGLVVDALMPRMSGFQVCAKIKGDPATREIPVVMVTALNEVSDIERAVECGLADHSARLKRGFACSSNARPTR